jgi:hypothetical protein
MQRKEHKGYKVHKAPKVPKVPKGAKVSKELKMLKRKTIKSKRQRFHADRLASQAARSNARTAIESRSNRAIPAVSLSHFSEGF